jgi:hypothetical protein
MTVASTQISESLQALIDCRLDTIDRMLLGRLSRQDRLAIVREVESQIHELLTERDTDELTREDVLAVLARLDPPEAYIPDETESHGAPIRVRSTFETPPRRSDRRTALTSGVLGLAALALVVIVYPALYMIALTEQSQFLALVFSGVTLAFALPAGFLGLVLGIHSRKSGVWAVVGIAASIPAFVFTPLVILSCFV